MELCRARVRASMSSTSYRGNGAGQTFAGFLPDRTVDSIADLPALLSLAWKGIRSEGYKE